MIPSLNSGTCSAPDRTIPLLQRQTLISTARQLPTITGYADQANVPSDNMVPYNFTCNPGDCMQFQVFYTPSLNWVATGADLTTNTFDMHICKATELTGTYALQQVNLNTSVWFENWFKVAGWQNNYSQSIYAWYALDGSLNNQKWWTKDNIQIYNGYGNLIGNNQVINGNLQGGSGAYWTLANIPLGQ
jgi:hypothetical protein